VSPRAPLELGSPPGYHWYLVPRVGYPDPRSFHAAYGALSELHDALWERTGIGPAATVLGGFSMGTVMSYSLGLGGERPAVAGILAFSGFIPTVEGWQASFDGREHTRVFLAHGRNDPVIEIGFARSACQTLRSGGLEVDYRESDAAHNIDPQDVSAAAAWLANTIV
jgi:phospholipase/carboxylesterase